MKVMQNSGERRDLSLLDTPWLDEIDFARLSKDQDNVHPSRLPSPRIRHRFDGALLGPGRSRNFLHGIPHRAPIATRSADARLRLADSKCRSSDSNSASGWKRFRSPARARLAVLRSSCTGLRPWPQVGTLADLMTRRRIHSVTPIIEQPLFLNLPDLPQPGSNEAAISAGCSAWCSSAMPCGRVQASSGKRRYPLSGCPRRALAAGAGSLSCIGARSIMKKETEHAKLQEAVERSVRARNCRRRCWK